MSFTCTHCSAGIADAAVNKDRQIATCGSCQQIVDLQPQMSGGKGRMRTPTSAPDGLELRDDGTTVTITRRWLRSKHFAFLAVVGAATAGIAYAWTQTEFSWLLAFGTLVVVTWDLRILTMFVNSTVIRADANHVDVRHGPLPTILFRNQSLPRSEIQQLFATKFGALYEVGAILNDGRRMTLVRPVVNEEQALFVEQRLENRLGIVDFEVDGELNAANLPPGAQPAVSPGAGGAMAILPVILIGVTVVAMLSMMSSSTEGSFEASGDRLGSWTFTPDSCESGETLGFFGAQLTSSKSETIVRAMRDPVRGTLIAIERAGNEPVVITPAECKALSVNVRKTDTNVNDVWVVEGSAQADCEEFRGSVTFSGCH